MDIHVIKSIFSVQDQIWLKPAYSVTLHKENSAIILFRIAKGAYQTAQMVSAFVACMQQIYHIYILLNKSLKWI